MQQPMLEAWFHQVIRETDSRKREFVILTSFLSLLMFAPPLPMIAPAFWNTAYEAVKSHVHLNHNVDTGWTLFWVDALYKHWFEWCPIISPHIFFDWMSTLDRSIVLSPPHPCVHHYKGVHKLQLKWQNTTTASLNAR